MLPTRPAIILAAALAALTGLLPLTVSAETSPTPASAPASRFAGIAVRAPDAFYDPPPQRPDRPGALLRSEPLTDVVLPPGMRGWRILYATTIDDHTRATAVATVFAPTDPPAGPRPVIMWEHGTTGLLQKCMPSLTNLPTLGIPALERVAQAGWVIVATDYSFAEKGGPHPYLIGEGEARAGLDAVRAARRMPELSLSPKTAVWGHSQGGHAALWTGIVGPRYAPEVELVGIAAIAPPGDIANLLAMNAALDRRLGPYLAAAYSRFYPNVTFERAVRPPALTAAREMTGLCGFVPPGDPLRTSELLKTYEGRALATDDAALAARLAQNAAGLPIAAPLLVAQGLADAVVLPAATDAYVEARCANGQRLDYWSFEGIDHSTIVLPGGRLDQPLMDWTAARFAGQPQARGCARRTF